MPSTQTIVHIFAQAPAKPVLGAPCNGCGVCCLLEPCPLGVVLCGHRTGACLALRWQPDFRLYRCGAITRPGDVLQDRLPRCLQFLSPVLAWTLVRWARRWVAAGIGCDCDSEVMPACPKT